MHLGRKMRRTFKYVEVLVDGTPSREPFLFRTAAPFNVSLARRSYKTLQLALSLFLISLVH